MLCLCAPPFATERCRDATDEAGFSCAGKKRGKRREAVLPVGSAHLPKELCDLFALLLPLVPSPGVCATCAILVVSKLEYSKCEVDASRLPLRVGRGRGVGELRSGSFARCERYGKRTASSSGSTFSALPFSFSRMSRTDTTYALAGPKLGDSLPRLEYTFRASSAMCCNT